MQYDFESDDNGDVVRKPASIIEVELKYEPSTSKFSSTRKFAEEHDIYYLHHQFILEREQSISLQDVVDEIDGLLKMALVDVSSWNYPYAKEQQEAIRFRVAGQPDATNDEDLTPIKEGMTTNQKRVFDARRKLQDRMLGLRRLQEIITERGGKVPDWANPYNEENRSYSKTLFEQDRYNDRLFKPLIAHIADIGKKHDLTPEEVSRYMKAKHSLERHESGTDALSDNPLDAWNMDLVNDLITDFEGKVSKQELDTLWKLTNKATWAAVEKIYQSGMMTRDQYLALQERGNKEWKHYVPLRGWKYEEGESPEETFEYIPMTRAANGRTVYNKALIKARGRNSEPDDPLGYISNIAQTSIIAGNHNHIGRQFLELMRLNKGNNDLYQIKELWYVLNPNTGTWEETTDRPDQEMIDASNSAAAKVTTMQRQLNKAVEIGDIALQDTLRDQIEEESKKVVVSRQINTGHTKKVARRLSEQHEFEVMDKGLKYVVITDPIVANA
ncbi:MAG: hypothetical protein EOM15_13630, partial [Spirochaetia bacterium]|nr:hypothetical protein [Spirochaetia bacterium]